MLLPFWLALSASVALHIGVLLAPGWGLPFDEEPEVATLDATIVLPTTVTPKPATPTPPAPRKKRPSAKPHSPPTPVTPQTQLPAEPAEPVEPVSAVPDADPVASAVDPEPAAVEAPPAMLPVLPPPTFADRWPRTGRIVYQVTRGEQGLIVGQSEQRWEHDGTRYSLHAEIETTGLAALFRPVKLVQDSRGVFDATGLRPLAFETQRDGKPQGSVRFEPEQGRIVLARGGSVPFVPAAQDLLSLFFQLAALSFDVPEYPLMVTTGRKVATYTISVGEELSLETPQGPRRVRHLKVGGNAREDSTEIWLDVESRLPLKIRHRDRKGEVFDQNATLIETEPLQ